MFIHNEKTRQQFGIKERMLLEVAKSIEIAYELCNLFTKYDALNRPVMTGITTTTATLQDVRNVSAT